MILFSIWLQSHTGNCNSPLPVHTHKQWFKCKIYSFYFLSLSYWLHKLTFSSSKWNAEGKAPKGDDTEACSWREQVTHINTVTQEINSTLLKAKDKANSADISQWIQSDHSLQSIITTESATVCHKALYWIAMVCGLNHSRKNQLHFGKKATGVAK